MFGIGGSEIIVILVVALLFLGPDKLPDAAKTISKGIRDLKKQSRALQQQIENDEKIGGAIRDLKSALRGEDLPVRPPVRVQPPKAETPELTEAAVEATGEPTSEPTVEDAKSLVTLPALAGEPDPDVGAGATLDDIGSLIKPAAGTVAKGADAPAPEPTDDANAKAKHG